jgi:hypothetical protein
MGYVHDTAMSQFVSPFLIGKSATATMTNAVTSNVWSDDRTANDSSFTIYVPVPVPGSSVALKGCYLKSIELMFEVAAGDCDNFATVALYKDTLQASAASGSGTLNTAAAVTITVDTGHDSAAERLAQDEHRMICTLSTPEWIDNDATFHLECVVDNDDDTEFNIYGAIINYTLRT